MARKNVIRKTQPVVVSQHQQITPRDDWHEVFALALAGAALLGLLALVSYAPEDFPPWEASRSGRAVGNYVGPVGAVAAWAVFFALGAGAYLLPLLAIGWAGAMLVRRGRVSWVSGSAAAVWVLSSCCMLDFHDGYFAEWVERSAPPGGTGGLVGAFAGRQWLSGSLGQPGATIAAGLLQVLSVMALTGFRPFQRLARPAAKLAPSAPLSTCEPAPAALPPARPVAARHGGQRMPVPREGRQDAGERKLEAPRRAPRATESIEAEVVDPAPRRGAIVNGETAPRAPAAPVEVVRRSRVVDSACAPAFVEAPMPPPPWPVRPRPAAAAAEAERAPVPERAARLAGDRLPGSSPAYQLPSLGLLDLPDASPRCRPGLEELRARQAVIIDTLRNFRVRVEPGDITCGPSVTRYELYPERGLSVRRIAALEADIALATRAKRITILAPIPGKDTVGIELANDERVPVGLRELLQAGAFADAKARVPLALGKDVYGKALVTDLAAMPHLLIAGATGSGKSVCLNTVVASLLYRFRPDELRLIMIDPKVVEMQAYARLPHLAVPVVTDTRKVLAALRWCILEMERRYRLFAETGVRKIDEYNAKARPPRPPAVPSGQGELFSVDDYFLPGGRSGVRRSPAGSAEAPAEPESPATHEKLPRIVVIIDELADLMQTAAADVETSICRLCQKARAAGIHVIVATQSPRADVVTGLIKANIPARIAFQVSSGLDSRVILDKSGAERLAGKGDMLFQPPDSAIMVRAQGAFLSDEEVERLVAHCAAQADPGYDPGMRLAMDLDEQSEGLGEISEEDEEVFHKALELIREEKRASTSFLQRRLRLGYTRAARLMDLLEERGVVGPGEGAKPREILVADDAPDR